MMISSDYLLFAIILCYNVNKSTEITFQQRDMTNPTIRLILQ